MKIEQQLNTVSRVTYEASEDLLTALPTDKLGLPDFPYKPSFSPLSPTIATHWKDLANVPPGWTGRDTPSVGYDGSIWVAAGKVLWTYVPMAGLFYPVWSGITRDLAAVSATEVWGVFRNSKGQNWCGQLTDKGYVALPALPGGRSPEKIWLDPSRDIWVQADDAIFNYQTETKSWLTLDTGLAHMDQISIGSAENIWGLQQTAQGSKIYRFVEGTGWKQESNPENAVEMVVACGDGSVWLGGVRSLYIRRVNEEVWQKVDMNEFSGIVSCFAAATGQGIIIVQSDLESYIKVSALKFGIVDQPADGWPAQTPGQSRAYLAISQQLGVNSEGGIRCEYTNAAERDSFSDWREDLRAMPCPPGVEPDDFKLIQKQLMDELHCVHVTYSLFENINDLNNQFMGLTGLMLPPIATLVGLTEKAEDSKKVIPAAIGAMVETAIMTMIFAVAGPTGAAGSFAIKLIYAGIKAGINATTKGPKPPDYRLQIAYAKFAETMANIFIHAEQTNADYQRKILTNWNMLRDAACYVDDGDWVWPVTESAEIVEHARPVLELFYLQSLMPAIWQIVHVLADKSIVPISSIPLSVQIFTVHEEKGKATDYVDLWFCNDLGASKAVQVPMTCKFPTDELMDTVQRVMLKRELNYLDFYQGKSGWALKQA